MTTKSLAGFAIWLVVGLLPALAQTPDGSISGEIPLPEQLSGSSVTEPGYTGYIVKGTDFTYANGSWHVPQVNCKKTPSGYSLVGVGLDGYNDPTLEVIGTASACGGGAAGYQAWYELYPTTGLVGIPLSEFPVAPGDRIGATVNYAGGVFVLEIHNYTTGKHYIHNGAVAGAKRDSAEWLVLEFAGYPLADFNYIVFGEDYNSSDPGSNDATDSARTKAPIGDFGSDIVKITMGSGGITRAVPTALSSDETSFKVNWKHE